jgi:hypothetical protein
MQAVIESAQGGSPVAGRHAEESGGLVSWPAATASRHNDTD